MSEHVLEITDSSFENDVLNASLPVLVDFWAPWCGPCKMIAPVLEELAKDFAGRLTIGKINVDANNAVAVKYSIMSIPALILFNKGQVIANRVGAASKAQLASFLEEHLG